MDSEQRKRIIESLVGFVEQTSKDKEAPPEAIKALPEVARLLLDVTRVNAS